MRKLNKEVLLKRAKELARKTSRPKRSSNKQTSAFLLAGGVGAYFLAKYAYKYYKEHPEIGDFIKENLDAVENSIREYRSNRDESDIETRH